MAQRPYGYTDNTGLWEEVIVSFGVFGEMIYKN